MNKNPHLALAKPVRSAWRVEGADEPLTVVEYQDEPAGHLDPDPGVEVSQLA